MCIFQGHTVAGSLLGGGGSQQEVAAQEPQQLEAYSQPAAQQQQDGGACALQLRQFIECTQGQADITLCQGFNEALRECRIRNG